jgi:aryl carrier-like protein
MRLRYRAQALADIDFRRIAKHSTLKVWKA